LSDSGRTGTARAPTSAPAVPVSASPSRPISKFALALALVALLALAVRIGFVVAVDPHVPAVGDASAYHLLAKDLADGRGYIRPFDHALLGRERPTAEYPPLFPAVLAVATKLGMRSVESQRIFLAFVGAGTVVCIGLLGKRVGGSRAGIVAALFAACYPLLFLSEGIAMSEALYVPLVALALLFAYRVLDAPTAANFALLGGVLGLATLTRAEGALVGLVLIVPLCWRLRTVPAARRVAFGGVALATMVVVVAPWTIRNEIRLDAFVPVSNNVATLVDGANCDPTYGGRQLGLWRETFSQFGNAARALPQARACFEGFDIVSPTFDEATVADQHRHDGLAYARHHLRSLPTVTTVRALRTWGVYAPRQQIDFESLEGRPRRWQLAGTVIYWVLLPFAVAGIVLLVRRKVPVWPLVAPAVVVVLTAAATYGQQRFRAAAEPALIVAAAVAVTALLRNVRVGADRSH
jgi:4-amino-4-deoxy-L-arabinose transferase-like glycosyltransferase